MMPSLIGPSGFSFFLHHRGAIALIGEVLPGPYDSPFFPLVGVLLCPLRWSGMAAFVFCFASFVPCFSLFSSQCPQCLIVFSVSRVEEDSACRFIPFCIPPPSFFNRRGIEEGVVRRCDRPSFPFSIDCVAIRRRTPFPLSLFSVSRRGA